MNRRIRRIWEMICKCRLRQDAEKWPDLKKIATYLMGAGRYLYKKWVTLTKLVITLQPLTLTFVQ